MEKFKSLTKYRKVCFIFFSALTLFCIWFIFSHSAKTAVESSEQSASITKIITDFINSVFGTSLAESDTVGTVRTLAHIAEFGGLAFAFASAFEAIGERKKASFKIALPFTVFIATIDEIIQIFFDGRAFQFTDILFDTLGGFLGILFLSLILKFINKSENGKQT